MTSGLSLSRSDRGCPIPPADKKTGAGKGKRVSHWFPPSDRGTDCRAGSMDEVMGRSESTRSGWAEGDDCSCLTGYCSRVRTSEIEPTRRYSTDDHAAGLTMGE